jgi:hypothetical protein
LQIADGNKGWLKIIDDLKDLDKERLAEVKHALYVQRLSTLLPLKDKEYKLSPLGEVDIAGKKAAGLRVSAKDRRDVNLFFDKERGLLVKYETVVKDPQMGDQELTQETIFSDWKQIQGRWVPMKASIKRDGKRFVESDTTEVQLAEELDAGLFARP